MIKIKKIIFIFIILNLVKGALLANDNLTLPHTFNSGNTISSTEMNENMNFLKPYFVKSNGIPIGVYYIKDLYEESYLFFNGTYKSSVYLDGNLYERNNFNYLDSNCTERIDQYIGVVFRMPDRYLTSYSPTSGTTYVYESYASYIPFDSQPIFDEDDIGVTKYYYYSISGQTCNEQTVREWTLNYHRVVQNDPNITGINNTYATPITIGK